MDLRLLPFSPSRALAFAAILSLGIHLWVGKVFWDEPRALAPMGTGLPAVVWESGTKFSGTKGTLPKFLKESPEAASSADSKNPSVHSWGETVDARSAGMLKGHYVHPEYPVQARRMGQEGTVKVGIEVKGGRVVEAKVLESSGFALLDKAAVSAIESWTFADASVLRFTQPVAFRLTD